MSYLSARRAGLMALPLLSIVIPTVLAVPTGPDGVVAFAIRQEDVDVDGDGPQPDTPPPQSPVPFPTEPNTPVDNTPQISPILPSPIEFSPVEPIFEPIPVQLFEKLACYAEPPRHEGRALTGPSQHSGDMTTERCAMFCADHKFFGLEYGQECFCGNTIASGSKEAEGKCTMPCAGDDSQTCGAGDHLNVYKTNNYIDPAVAQVSGYTYLGCHTEGVSGRALTAKHYDSDDMTPQKCAGLCSSGGYNYAGVEWGRECFCDNSLRNGGNWVGEHECTKLCAGDKNSFCGEGQRLTLYGPAAIAAAVIPGWDYVGCGVDVAADRVLSSQKTGSEDMTAEKCAADCSDYEYFGLEHGTECFCGRSYGGAILDDKECGMPCGGNGLTTCGDADRLNLYVSKTVSVTPPSTGDFHYKHCAADKVQDRVLKGKHSGAAGMTVDKCAEFCTGFTYFGVEFGKECFCGNEYTGEEKPIEDCHSKCVGDSSQLCGGKDRISVYDSTPLPPPIPNTPQPTGNCGIVGRCAPGSNPYEALSVGSGFSLEICSIVASFIGFISSVTYNSVAVNAAGDCYALRPTVAQCDPQSDASPFTHSDLTCFPSAVLNQPF